MKNFKESSYKIWIVFFWPILLVISTVGAVESEGTNKLILVSEQNEQYLFQDIRGRDDLKIANEGISESGIRHGIANLKRLNAVYQSGKADEIVLAYENNLKEKFSSRGFLKTGIKVNIRRTDFKGWYITCEVKPGCEKIVSRFLGRIKVPWEMKSVNAGKNVGLFNTAWGPTFQEAYVRSRLSPGLARRPELASAITEMMDSAIAQSLGIGLSEVNFADEKFRERLNSPEFLAQLEKNIGEMRGLAGVNSDAHLTALARALDSLEIPFTSPSHLNAMMENALSPSSGDPIGQGRYFISEALSGDDEYLMIKDSNKKMITTVGVDARGLGVINMMERLKEYVEMRSLSGKLTNEKFFSFSMKALGNADKIMFKSFEAYRSILENEIATINSDELKQKITKANKKYSEYVKEKPGLMQMRAASIGKGCGVNVKCIMNQISLRHNIIKKMEKIGIEDFFGDSCIGLEYWARRLNLVPVVEIRR